MTDDGWKALCEFVRHPTRYREPDLEPWDVVPRPPKAKSRKRRVTLARALRQAERADVPVRAATVRPDGSVALELGKSVTENSVTDANEWDSVKQ
jgi:hypothetical protein